MALVDYSDSDESSEDAPLPPLSKATPKPPATHQASNFAIDKSNPRKIRLNLQERVPPPSKPDETNGQPAPKRARTGGAFNGFNALLPPPKRDAETTRPSVGGGKPASKVFGLKTGAEPGFSRESDAELRELFAEQAASKEEDLGQLAYNGPPATGSTQSTVSSMVKTGNAMMFKPLSVARNPQKRRKVAITAETPPQPGAAKTPQTQPHTPATASPSKKISLFSSSDISESVAAVLTGRLEEYEDVDGVDFIEDENAIIEPSSNLSVPHASESQPQSLEDVASDLNLSASARRQLLGRHGTSTSTAINIVNFNTDAEYAANEEIRASGEQVRHNPVRAITSGKHSLKQLVSAATVQKDALEESFASGRRNKKEAGNKYGW